MTDQDVPSEDSPTTHPGEWGTFDPAQINQQRQATQNAPFEEYTDPAPVEAETPAFDDRYKQPFQGLLYIGALTQQFDFLGHTIVIRTLTADEDLALGELTRQWMDTAAFERAYVTATVAMSIISIDGQQPPIPIGRDETGFAWAYQRFNWVKANLLSLTIDRIYREFNALDGTAREVLAEMEKAHGSSEATSQELEDASDF